MAVEKCVAIVHSRLWEMAVGARARRKRRFVLILLLVSGSEATGSRQCPAVVGLSFSLCTETGPLCVVFSSALGTLSLESQERNERLELLPRYDLCNEKKLPRMYCTFFNTARKGKFFVYCMQHLFTTLDNFPNQFVREYSKCILRTQT